MFGVKICGMRSREDVELCVEAGADAVGFIFALGPRWLSLDEAASLTRHVPPHVSSVGVFAGNDAALVREAMRRCRLDILQFSGGEAPELRGSFGMPTISVVHVSSASDSQVPAPQVPGAAALRAANAIALMLDSRSGGKIGGTGIRVDQALAARLARGCPLPLILAGGLTPGNVAEAIAAVQPGAVDVRSGVERNGQKDRSLVEQFVRESHRALHNVATECSNGPIGPLTREKR